METRAELLKGTLDLLILRSLVAGPLHGLGIARRIGLITGQTFDIKPGSLFPALYRLEERGFLHTAWSADGAARRLKNYDLTPLGRRQLQTETAQWKRASSAVTAALEGEA